MFAAEGMAVAVDTPLPLAETVIVLVPAVVPLPATSVNAPPLSEASSEAGVNVPVTPDGKPPTLSETAPLKPPPRVICSATTLVPPTLIETLVGTSVTLNVPVCPGGCVVPPSPPPHAFNNAATRQKMSWSAKRAGRVVLPERASRIIASSNGRESGIDVRGPRSIAQKRDQNRHAHLAGALTFPQLRHARAPSFVPST